MASVKIEGGKLHGANAAKAQFRHAAPDSRLVHEHSNKDIDKSKIPLNTSINGLSYVDVCKRYDERIQALDSTTNTNKRKDRLTGVCMVLNLPKGIPDERQDQWFLRAVELMKDKYKSENFLECYVHRDEVHEYKDPDTGETKLSDVHGHVYWIPEHEGKLNGKWFTSRANLVELNTRIENMTFEEFGVHFMTGEKTKSRGKTDDMKRRSADRMLKDAQAKLDTAKTVLKIAHQTAQQAYGAQTAVNALETAAEESRKKLYDQADEALKRAYRASEWHPDELAEKHMKRRKAKFRNKDGSITEKSYWDLIQEDLQRDADAQNAKQTKLQQEQETARVQAERQHKRTLASKAPKQDIGQAMANIQAMKDEWKRQGLIDDDYSFT